MTIIDMSPVRQHQSSRVNVGSTRTKWCLSKVPMLLDLIKPEVVVAVGDTGKELTKMFGTAGREGSFSWHSTPINPSSDGLLPPAQYRGMTKEEADKARVALKSSDSSVAAEACTGGSQDVGALYSPMAVTVLRDGEEQTKTTFFLGRGHHFSASFWGALLLVGEAIDRVGWFMRCATGLGREVLTSYEAHRFRRWALKRRAVTWLDVAIEIAEQETDGQPETYVGPNNCPDRYQWDAMVGYAIDKIGAEELKRQLLTKRKSLARILLSFFCKW